MKKTILKRLFLFGVCAALVACGGGGGGSSVESAANALSAPPVLDTAPGGPLEVKAVYQPTVHSLGNDTAGPQLIQADAAGKLRFDRPVNVQVGSIVIVAGTAYAVTAIEEGGFVLQTRSPEMGEIFQRLTIRGTISVGTNAEPRETPRAATPIGEFESKIAFAQDFFIASKIKAGLSVNLAANIKIAYDFVAPNGVTEFLLEVDGEATDNVTLTYDASGGAANVPDGIVLGEAVYRIPQTAGAVAIRIPLVAQAQATGDLKVSVGLHSGSNTFQVSSKLNKQTNELETTGSFSDNSTAGSLEVASPPANGSARLGLAFRFGPDFQLSLFESIRPFTAGLRIVPELSAEMTSDEGEPCLSWKIEGKGEMTGELKLNDALKWSNTYSSAKRLLYSGGNREQCSEQEDPPPSEDPETPVPGDQPPSHALSTPAGEALLPSPTNVPLLEGYELRILGNRMNGDDSQCTPYVTQQYSYDNCRTVLETAVFKKGESEPVLELSAPGFPAMYQGSACRLETSAPSFFYGMNYGTQRFEMPDAPMIAPWDVNNQLDRSTSTIFRLRGNAPAPVASLRIVCQLDLVDKVTPSARYYLRQERYFSDFYSMGGASQFADGRVTWLP